MPTRDPAAPRGGTLFELLACLMIASVVLALSVPRYHAWHDEIAAREAASDVVNVLGSAREAAVLRAAFVAVVLDTAADTVWWHSEGAIVGRHAVAARYGVDVAANRDSVVYDPSGLGYGASTVTIILRRGAAAETITVSRMGRVHW